MSAPMTLTDWMNDDEWWEQLGSADFDPSYESWCKRAVDEIIAEEEADEDYETDPYWKRGDWSDSDFEPF